MSAEKIVSHPVVAEIGQTLRLKVAVFYEDLSAGLRARQMLEEITCRLAFNVDLDLTAWRFDLLLEPALLQEVTHDTETADIVFLAGYGKRELPAAVKAWFLSWLATRGGAPSALAVSVDSIAMNIPATMATLDLLRGAAGLAGVEVLVDFRKAPGAGAELRIEDSPNRTETDTTVPEALSRGSGDHYYAHWGLND